VADPDLTSPTLRVIAPKPKMTIYFALLILSLLAMLTACIFLYLEISRYWRENNGQSIAALPPTSVLVSSGGIERMQNI
jgi:hypothetical protein